MSGKIDLERQDNGVATLRINNPAHRNALNNGLIESLTGYYRVLASDPDCRVIVVCGRDGIFCAAGSCATCAPCRMPTTPPSWRPTRSSRR